jgi:Na+-transporting NADH:ubiquinone oxidoreductase subunit F
MSEIILGSVVFTVIVVGLAALVLGARAILLPALEVTITVNDSRKLRATTGQKLLSVLNGNGILLPSTCGGAGTCGLCRVTVLRGGGEVLPTETTKLARREVREGSRLACQMVVREDLAVELPDELFGIQDLDCTVRSSRTLAPLIKELVLDLPAGAELNFQAGAFVQVTVPPFRAALADFQIAAEYEAVWDRLRWRELKVHSPRPATRAYSIANRPEDRGHIVLNVRLALPPPGTHAPPGIVSSYLFALKPGDAVRIVGPFGNFRARESDREMVFIGGGVGMAPLRAIIFDQLERLRTHRKITFWYGARNRTELFYADQFDQLQLRYDNFAWTVALSDAKPEDNWDGPTGFIHEIVFENLLKDHAAPEDCDYYICGPPLMIKAVFAMLDNLGVARENILFDDFGS